MTADPTRRLFLSGLLAAPALLSGCKVLDGLSATDHPLRNIMEGTNRLTHETQKLLTRDALAPEYSRADIRQGMRPNGTTNPQDADYQAFAANAPYFFGPTVRDVPIPAAARAYTPATPDEVLRLQTVDWSKIAPVRGRIVEQFDRLFAA